MVEPARPVAIVTGGSSGIGQATALLLVQRGWDVGLTFCMNKPGADEVVRAASDAGARVATAHLDLTNPDAGPAVIASLIDQLAGITAFVSCAGVNRREFALNESLGGWRSALAVNLTGAVLCSRTAAAQMVADKVPGRIVHVTSVVAQLPISGGGAYCAAKAALAAHTRVMALELAPHGVTVNEVAPGHTITRMNYDDSELSKTTIAQPVIPMGRSATPREIAETIVFFTTDAASYITGATLVVDGGLGLVSGPDSLQRVIGQK